MLTYEQNVLFKLVPRPLALATLLVLVPAAIGLCPSPAYATVWNVMTNCGAVGNETNDDTNAINTCIGSCIQEIRWSFPRGLIESQQVRLWHWFRPAAVRQAWSHRHFIG